LEKKLNWFDDLQKLINKGTTKCKKMLLILLN